MILTIISSREKDVSYLASLGKSDNFKNKNKIGSL